MDRMKMLFFPVILIILSLVVVQCQDDSPKIGDHGEVLEQNILDSEAHFDHDQDNIPLDTYDFDPSEGLSFVVSSRREECFYQTITSLDDHVSGAYIVMAASPSITLVVYDPSSKVVLSSVGKPEGEYKVDPLTLTGEYKICFSNADGEEKLVTHVTHTLLSQHPVERSHVSQLAKYAKHLDVKLGELESEQRLLQLRTDRHLKTEESTNHRVTFYSSLELGFYLFVSIGQVFYIKQLLGDNNSSSGRYGRKKAFVP